MNETSGSFHEKKKFLLIHEIYTLFPVCFNIRFTKLFLFQLLIYFQTIMSENFMLILK